MFVLRRGARALLTLLIVATAVFVATRLSGDPTYFLLPPTTPEAERQALRQQLGLDRSIVVQYAYYLRDVAGGNFGQSLFTGRDVVETYAERISITLALTIPALFLALLLGLPAGVIASLRRNSVLDRTLMSVAFLGQAIPNFVLGIVLILVFSLSLKLLPSGGAGELRHYLLPVATLGLATAATIARLARSSMLDVLGQEYIRFAESKGLSPAHVVVKHGLRNALLPVLTILGLQIGTLVSGAVIVETVFSWPGAGRLLVSAVLERDFPLLQFGVLVVAATVILANALVDVCYGLLDPRARESAG